MNTTARLHQSTKERLVRLQETWQRRSGERLSQTDLLEKAMKYVEMHADHFLDETGFRPWPQNEIERYFASLPTWDGPSDWSDTIDEYAYSREQLERDPE